MTVMGWGNKKGAKLFRAFFFSIPVHHPFSNTIIRSSAVAKPLSEIAKV